MGKKLIKLSLLFLITINLFLIPNLNQKIATKSLLDPNQHSYWPTKGWKTSSPEAQGMDSSVLNLTSTYISENNLPVDSIIVIRHGYLVYEEYPRMYLFNENTKHLLYSVTKSFSSALIGIALDNDYIQSIQDKIVSFFPEYTITNPDARKYEITIEHLLKMRSGFEWDESTYPILDSRNDVMKLIQSDDSIQFLLDRSLYYDPNQGWHYNTGDSHLLSAIIQSQTNQTTLDFAQDHLFNPLGISNVYWSADKLGINYGGFDLSLLPRDMAKFGYLYLNKGNWDGTQIIPTQWIENSIFSHTTINSRTGYGYQFWISKNLDYYYAAGLYGQKIMIIPDQDMVVVFTANFQGSDNAEEVILSNYVLNSVTNSYSLNNSSFTNSTGEIKTTDVSIWFPGLFVIVLFSLTKKKINKD